ncbi:hypothetical protein ACFLTP_02315 [Chloroflexota bacterium]
MGEITIIAVIIVLVILVILEAIIIYAVDSLAISGLMEIMFKSALPVTILLGFLITRIGNR